MVLTLVLTTNSRNRLFLYQFVLIVVQCFVFPEPVFVFPESVFVFPKYLGVSMVKTKIKIKWEAQINHNGEKVHLGRFDNEIQAAKARDIATIKYYGEYGKLNFPITS
jgi:hypothetical protein